MRLEIDEERVISLKEARKILGRESANSSDEELTILINTLDEISKSFLRDIVKNRANSKSGGIHGSSSVYSSINR